MNELTGGQEDNLLHHEVKSYMKFLAYLLVNYDLVFNLGGRRERRRTNQTFGIFSPDRKYISYTKLFYGDLILRSHQVYLFS
jgi:hypothetical protein